MTAPTKTAGQSATASGRSADAPLTSEPAPAPTASHEPVHALLADGTTVSIRPTTAQDLDDPIAMFSGMSAQSLRMRFFASGTAAGRSAAERLCEPHLFSTSVRERLSASGSTASTTARRQMTAVSIVIDDGHGRPSACASRHHQEL